MRSDVVEITIDDLIGDYDRTGRELSKSELTKIFLKREMTTEESNTVIKELILKNIPLSWDDLGNERREPASNTENSESKGKFPHNNLNFITKYRLLTKDEERSLGRAVQLGIRTEKEVICDIEQNAHRQKIIKNGQDARNSMILANLRLVRKVVSHFRTYLALSEDDLFQEGVIGLVKAVEKFDPTLDYKFSTYAVWWIRQSIERALMDKGYTIRLPVHVAQKVKQLRKATRLLSALHNNSNPSSTDLARELGWSVEEVYFVESASLIQPSSIDESLKDTNLSLNHLLTSSINTPEEEYSIQQIQSELRKHLELLSERELSVIYERFGLNTSEEEKTLESIGQIYNVTRERIRQIEAAALKKLARPNSVSRLRENFRDD
ncbi:sigma-70 family RNA polymerase sigma factor [Idiomarina abyssalis]|uniref:sigma-70 family RNA polymerase sigma factor n=1 Tax=Idiomarina abyssalis TaxID=86102 RepID=UPI003A903A51